MFDQILAWKNLRLAWEQTRQNKGAPGVDEVTLARWERNWETNLTRMTRMARAGTYRPSRPREIYIAKTGGGQRKISILTVTDRVFQRATLNILQPVFEKIFLPCSFGYRPKRSAAKAVNAVLMARASGLRHVLDADIHHCFDNLGHARILDLAGPLIGDPRVMGLIKSWLLAGANHPARQRRVQALGVGIALGAPLSPLWCNVILHQMDLALTQNPNIRLARYADDFVVLAADEAAARDALAQTTQILGGLGLALAPAKTRLTSFEHGFDFLGVHFEGDEFSYAHSGKRVRATKGAARLLRLYPPQAYASRW